MKIRIELLSDLCCASGDSFNSAIDTDVVVDEYGLPYIPAKRLKGCIREAMMELESMGVVPQSTTIRLFGKEGNSRASFSLGNAYLLDYEARISDILSTGNRALTHPINVRDLYSYLRTQTAMKDGVAKENSLRTMRVVKRGLVMECDVTFGPNVSEDEKNNFGRAVSTVKHIGMNRTRGLGQVEMKLCSGEKVEPRNAVSIELPKTPGMVKLEYVIKLKSPAICKSEEGDQTSTLDYFPGNKILGIIIERMGYDKFSKLVGDRDIMVSNAYISCGNTRFTPVAKSLQKRKDSSYIAENENADKVLSVFDLLNDYCGDEQLSPVGAIYVSPDGYSKTVKTEIQYHHRRPEDKSIGHANGEDESQLYQLESISRGQNFSGFIRADQDVIQQLVALFPQETDIRIGYGRNAEYGHAVFAFRGVSATSVNVEKKTEFAIKLNSPLIIYNENGVPSADSKLMKYYLEKALGISGLELTGFYAAYDTIGGYNVTWGKRKPIFTALGAGTVARFCYSPGVDVSELCQLGERTKEGFGEIELYDNTKSETFLFRRQPDNYQNEEGYKEKTDILSMLRKQQCERTIIRDARAMADDIVKNSNLFGRKEIDSVISKLLLMVRGEESLEKMLDQVAGIETESKRNLAKDIMKDATKYLKQDWTIISQESAYKLFVMEYLTQIKYRIRPSREERRNGDD